MTPALQAEIHSILSQFYVLMDGMDLILRRDNGAAQDALSTMIVELQRRLPLNSEHSIATAAESKEMPLPF